MNPKLTDYIAGLLSLAEKRGLRMIDERDIDYGVQIKLANNTDEIPINIYYSQKKGITSVIGGRSANPLKPVLQKLLNQKIESTTIDHNWTVWAGTDESGKGDFFGPLAVCGFICKKAMIPSLIKLGVQDSKKIKDEQIIIIAKHLFSRFMPQIETLVLMPAKYNELYEKFRMQNKKLNEMLAWMHGRVILNLKKKHDFEGAVVDKFASDKTLLSSLKDMKGINLKHQVKAERDLAVAAASIIARYLFLKNMKSLSDEYNIELPKGASKKVIETAQIFSNEFGKNKLRDIAKIHFKTYNEIKDNT